ncbi:hypothetical protein T11_5267 [Trichinella zimbabwensis]|uniref:Uncharacterized protein n=1 Tax=Trichinella zimbabwensis TaxID=268475 RepID=A0A0V1GAT3_9BILA|nr:hypothetical protein T11_5267 [Trichinella zimbabwensis]
MRGLYAHLKNYLPREVLENAFFISEKNNVPVEEEKDWRIA